LSIEEYYQSQLATVGLSPYVQAYDIELDKRGPELGLIRGEIRFLDGSMLFYRELVDLEFEPVLAMYSYHYQKADYVLIFRYDDAPHYTNLPGFPHHKHAGTESSVIPAKAPVLLRVLREIESRL